MCYAMKRYYLNESYLLNKEPPTPNSNQLVLVYSMSTNPEPVPGPGTESCRLVLEAGWVPCGELTLWWGHWVPERTVTNQVWFIRKAVTEENVMRGKV